MAKQRKRAFTLVEVLLTSIISAILVGATASAYIFTATRSSEAIATSTTSNQMQDLSKRLDLILSQATSVTSITVSGNTGIKCIMPQNEVDSDGDGIADSYTPKASVAGVPRWGTGKRIWFYMSSNGNWNSPGTILYKAIRSDDALPVNANTDKDFTYYQNTGQLRYALLDSIAFVVNAANNTAGYTIKASALARADRRSPNAATTDSNISQMITMARTVYTANWKQ